MKPITIENIGVTPAFQVLELARIAYRLASSLEFVQRERCTELFALSDNGACQLVDMRGGCRFRQNGREPE
jgi:hypothetical protein